MGNLQAAGNTDLPFATQRSDNWKMEEVPKKFPMDASISPRERSRRQRHEVKKALRLDDMGRRLKEARAFIDEHKEKYEKERKAWERRNPQSGQ